MEIWKDVVGYEGIYQVSNLSNIKNILKNKMMSQYIDNKGYKKVKLSYNGNRSGKLVHRIVAISFLENEDGKPCVNHIDGNKLNNNLKNLEWCTYAENNEHALKNNLKFTSIRNNLEEIILDYKNGMSFYQLSKKYKVCKNTLPKILKEKGLEIKHGGYKIKRYEYDKKHLLEMFKRDFNHDEISYILNIPKELSITLKYQFKKKGLI